MSAIRATPLQAVSVDPQRYSYDDPPEPGHIVTSPAGRSYLVINVTKDRRCICVPQARPEQCPITFQANDLRKAWPSLSSTNQQVR